VAGREGDALVIYEVTIGGRSARVEIKVDRDGGYRVSIGGGAERTVRGGPLGAAEWWIEEDGVRRTIALCVEGEALSAQVGGFGVPGSVVDPRSRAVGAIGRRHEGAIVTPMPGSVARVLASVGQTVTRGQVLVVVEAMKMENEFRSPIDGVVAKVVVEAGRPVDANALLVVVDPT
jgi:biotin carboxyl carrier protein